MWEIVLIYLTNSRKCLLASFTFMSCPCPLPISYWGVIFLCVYLLNDIYCLKMDKTSMFRGESWKAQKSPKKRIASSIPPPRHDWMSICCASFYNFWSITYTNTNSSSAVSFYALFGNLLLKLKISHLFPNSKQTSKTRYLRITEWWLA